jgi:hypothetical protein
VGSFFNTKPIYDIDDNNFLCICSATCFGRRGHLQGSSTFIICFLMNLQLNKYIIKYNYTYMCYAEGIPHNCIITRVAPLELSIYKSVSTSPTTQCFTYTKTGQLILFIELITVYFENHTRPINTQWKSTVLNV